VKFYVKFNRFSIFHLAYDSQATRQIARAVDEAKKSIDIADRRVHLLYRSPGSTGHENGRVANFNETTDGRRVCEDVEVESSRNSERNKESAGRRQICISAQPSLAANSKA
jgi:hypothetical protein